LNQTGVGYDVDTTEMPSGGSLLPTRPPIGASAVEGNKFPKPSGLSTLVEPRGTALGKQQAGSAAFLLIRVNQNMEVATSLNCE
jgi:hypothetical protein